MYEESETKLMVDGKHVLSVYSHEISVGRSGKESLKLVMLLKENYGIYQCRD